ncbi:MAG: glycosyltransferase [Promethearchaeota archaeon]|nr:MAG: glycosyltransferase [Candidatus Lokiarchaeota archaeon]
MNNDSNSLLEKYRGLIGNSSVNRLRKKTDKLKKQSILHVNSTKFGGGVAEILNSMLPLMKEFELDVDWRNFTAPDKFFEISKKMHNALQGNMDIHFSDEEITIYKKQALETYKQVEPREDFIVIHDPQPCPVIGEEMKRENKWIWRCHIDTSEPNPQAWNLISDYLPMYDALIFTKLEFARKGVHQNIHQITPSIDPFSVKNKPLEEDTAREIVEEFIPLNKPLITQVSRFDPWKDPLGVIDVYRKVSEQISVSLALIGSLAHDDPEGVEWLEKVKKYAKDDENIYILSNLDGVADLEVNAFQRVSDVVLQKSIREGFGLTVTEALWKETPVVGGNVGGIKLQIEDGKNGFLVDSIDEAAEKVLYLLKNPKRSKEMGKKGREKVKNNFLLFSHLERYIDLFRELY